MRLINNSESTPSAPTGQDAPTFSLSAANVTLRRTGKAILDNVTASFAPGQLSVVLGPNGAGKSTLLKIVSGALEADTGTVALNDRPLKNYAPSTLARQRAFLTQDAALSSDFSVEEVVLLGRIPHLSGWESAHDWSVCEWALGAVEMMSFRSRRFLTLSGGEKQRVHLARVLAQLADDARHGEAPAATPRWLLLDEPTSALDLRHQHAVLSMVRRFTREFGFGALAVLHDLNLAMRYADKVVLMHQGKVVAAGPTRDTLTCERISSVYDVQARIFCATPDACPFVQTEVENVPR
ncbi:MAG: heme ABC transporter ATP-binding protein [Puniceicoccales bacterium]|jgi:iron complex transport system ATP-binding protein|nr:heme ABC transporter ATP-binding protein [Puniceicoccales bacterium]